MFPVVLQSMFFSLCSATVICIQQTDSSFYCKCEKDIMIVCLFVICLLG